MPKRKALAASLVAMGMRACAGFVQQLGVPALREMYPRLIPGIYRPV